MNGSSRILDNVDRERRDAVEERVEELLADMTLEQKAGQLTQFSAGFLTGTDIESGNVEDAVAAGLVGSLLNVESLADAREFQELAVEESPHGIPLVLALDVIHGYRTTFPAPIGEAATWDPDLVERSSAIAATEAAANGVHWTFAPDVDVTRDPRWGRVMETSGEDPTLASAFARARVRGFQGDDLAGEETLAACAKHYVGYGASEGGRDYNTVNVSETNLREQHLPPFAAAVDEGVATVMNAFNVHERIPASGSEYLVDEVLKGDLGFGGLLVSDWNSFGEIAVHGAADGEREAAKAAITAGSHVDMVSGVYDHLPDLVREGEVDEATVDEAVRRVLELKGALGLFEDPYRYFDEERAESAVLTDGARETARESARESAVLLENDEGLLPLSPDDDVALVGPYADEPAHMLSSWTAEGRPDDVTTLRAAMADRHEGDLTHVRACDPDGTPVDGGREAALDAAADADVVLVTVGEPRRWGGEAASRAHLDLPGEQGDLVAALAEADAPVACALFSSRPLAVPDLADSVAALLEAWFPGTEAGPGVADVLYGDSDPGGRLPVSVPRTEGQVPVYYNHLNTGRPVPEEEEHHYPPTEDETVFCSRYLDVPNEPLYPFGYGRSYADVEYVDWAFGPETVADGESVTVEVTVENGSDRPATEVVQVYTRDRVGSRARPVKELAAFEKVHLGPGERRAVTAEVDAEDLAFWTADEEWAAEPGTFDLMVGRSSADIAFSGAFELVE
ncbi:MAG: glycoside hydrolase family 3 N-terminal domain-containing protein [Haloarculaceae archaeon]